TLFQYVGTISSHERTAMPHTAYAGTRCAFTRLHIRCPGMAPSRENANIIREADVTEAVPQKNCATTAMTRRNSADFVLIDDCQMYVTMLAPASRPPFVLGTANVTATRSAKPKMTDTTTDMTMPDVAAR